MTDLLNYKRPLQDAKKTMSKILEEGTAINLGRNDRGETIYLLIDFDRNDRRPLVTVSVGGQFLSPQEFINETQGSKSE